MGSFLRLSGGVPRSFAESSSSPIYDQSIAIVTSGGNGSTSLNAPVTAGTPITLPAGGTYTVTSGVPNINIYINGSRTEYIYDWATSGSGPNYTAFQLTFDLAVGDRIDLRAERA